MPFEVATVLMAAEHAAEAQLDCTVGDIIEVVQRQIDMARELGLLELYRQDGGEFDLRGVVDPFADLEIATGGDVPPEELI